MIYLWVAPWWWTEDVRVVAALGLLFAVLVALGYALGRLHKRPEAAFRAGFESAASIYREKQRRLADAHDKAMLDLLRVAARKMDTAALGVRTFHPEAVGGAEEWDYGQGSGGPDAPGGGSS